MFAVFASIAPTPGGYENLDAESAKAVREVYRYDAAAEELRCISCNPSGARVASRPGLDGAATAAARIQGFEALGRAPRVISEDGSRVFFESHEALVPRDVNQSWDVYQWEEAGRGTCTSADPAYGEAAGGCVDLISSGQSAVKSTFLDADPSGENAFFGTRSALVAADGDGGLNDVYVARVGGGFPDPPLPVEPCEGEGCRGASPAAAEGQGAATPSFEGAGDPKPRPCARMSRRARALGRSARRLRQRARGIRRGGPGASRQKARRYAKAAQRRARGAKRLRAAAKRCRRARAGGGRGRAR
jgi:hypothetical protein